MFDELEGRGIWSGQLFGMGEGLFVMSRLDDPREARLRTVGTPLSELDEVRILLPGTEVEAPYGEVGELCCRGPYTIPGYYAAGERNALAFTPDGFYRTGDLARWETYNGRAHLLIEGRIKDVINRGGEKINAEEIELLLLRHPDIRQAAVVAMPDARLGERSCAYVVARAAVDLPTRPAVPGLTRRREVQVARAGRAAGRPAADERRQDRQAAPPRPCRRGSERRRPAVRVGP